MFTDHWALVFAEWHTEDSNPATRRPPSSRFLLFGPVNRFAAVHRAIKSVKPVLTVVIGFLFVFPAKHLWEEVPSLCQPKWWSDETKLKKGQFCRAFRLWLQLQIPSESAAQNQKADVRLVRINKRQGKEATEGKTANQSTKNAMLHQRFCVFAAAAFVKLLQHKLCLLPLRETWRKQNFFFHIEMLTSC